MLFDISGSEIESLQAGKALQNLLLVSVETSQVMAVDCCRVAGPWVSIAYNSQELQANR